MDRDAKFSEAFRAALEQAGVEAVRLPPRSPNLPPHIERSMRTALSGLSSSEEVRSNRPQPVSYRY